jgi:hypothetical protein
LRRSVIGLFSTGTQTMKTFDSLTEREILAPAISLEEEDARCGLRHADLAGRHRAHAAAPDSERENGDGGGRGAGGLGVISWLRHRFMDTPWASALFQVALGGALVFLAGILIGNS